MRGSTVRAAAVEPGVVDCAGQIVDRAAFVVDWAAVPEVAGDVCRPAGSGGWNVTPNPVPWIE